jgi:hypothetical protein
MILNESYGVGGWGMDKRIVPPMVDAHFIDVQSSYFKMSKKNRLAWEMKHHANQNPLSSIWQKLSINALLASKLSEFHKFQ